MSVLDALHYIRINSLTMWLLALMFNIKHTLKDPEHVNQDGDYHKVLLWFRPPLLSYDCLLIPNKLSHALLTVLVGNVCLLIYKSAYRLTHQSENQERWASESKLRTMSLEYI